MVFSCAKTVSPAVVGTPSNTVCTNTVPFRVCVHSDNAEWANPAPLGEGTLANNRGYKLSKIFICTNYKIMGHFSFQVTSNKLPVRETHKCVVCI